MLSTDSVITVQPDVVSREVQGEEVILDLTSGTYFGLNEVGTRIWTLLKGKSSLKKVIRTIEQEFDVDPAAAEKDTLNLVEKLASKKLVRIR